jgi:hypothetical protein
VPECPLEQENPHRQGQPSRNADGSGQIAQEGVSENVICVEKSSAKGETDAEPSMKHAVILPVEPQPNGAVSANFHLTADCIVV